MKFTVKERILLIQLPPARGSFLVLTQMREFREACGFSDAEMDLMKMETGAVVTWDAAKEVKKTIEFSHHVHACIAEGLKTLSNRNQLSEEALGLYQRFVRE